MLFPSPPRLPRYMGSQRNALNELTQAVDSILLRDRALYTKFHSGNASIIDMCSGSGAVSQHWRQKGWETTSIDIEPYTWYWNYYAMNCSQDLLVKELQLYRALHDLSDDTCIIEWWNNLLKSINHQTPYFEKYYAPHDGCERMYYTPCVARWLDRALHIHTNYDWSETPLLHAYFVSEILNNMISASNTSGTMKSYHAQWGGPTKHRLADIQTVPQLKPFWLIQGPTGSAYVKDITLPTEQRADIIYCNPPSTVHQYGSCYHLLNTFVLGAQEVPKQGKAHGTKAGILKATSSEFSKTKTLKAAWAAWLKSNQNMANWLLVSYSKEGLLSSPELATILQNNGRHTVEINDVGDFYIYTVRTNVRQNPKVLKTMLSEKQPQPPSLGEYFAPQLLAPFFKLEQVATKIFVFDNNQCLASINRRYKVKWVKLPTTQQRTIWLNAEFGLPQLFNQYLIDKEWLSALTCLRKIKRLRHKKEFREQWNMLYHLAQSHGQKEIVKKLQLLSGS